MILTKNDLRECQENMRISIPDSLIKEHLDTYGIYVIDDDGQLRDYTEQDICEQIRK